jgi:NADP-dependent alcohol dehydrogenase
MRVRQQQKGEKIRQLGARVFGITQGSSEARTAATIEKINKFFVSLGTPTRLSACGLGVDAIPKVVTNLKNRGLTAIGERSDITPETVEAILAAAI